MTPGKFSVVLRRDSDSPLIELSPWYPPLERILVYETQTFDPRNRYPVVEKKALFYKTDKDGMTVGYFPAGMLRRVVKCLRDAGCEMTAIDDRDRSRYFPEPDLSAAGELREGQQEVLDAIIKSDVGMIVCSTGFGKSFIISALTMIYKKSRFLIIAPGIAETENLYSRIAKLTNDVSMLGGGSPGSLDARIIVSTSKSFHKVDMSKIDFVLFDEAHGCGNNKVSQTLLDNIRGSRIFGFTASPKGRSDKADMVMEALFGPPIIDFTYQDTQAMGNVTPIEVQLWDVPGEIPSSKSRFGNAMTQNRRRFYWNNAERNRLIKAIADSVPEDEQVLVMVDTVEHLIRLGSTMPDFALICGDGNDLAAEAKARKLPLTNRLGDTKEEYEKLVDEFRTGKLRRAISTFRWKQAVDFPELSVLIRGDGSKSAILATQVPGRLSRLSPGKERGLLVDFIDRFNPSAMRKSLARIREYKEKGWTINRMGVFK